ncbi:MAG: hypothetical protein J7647_29810 [Cyanobacteria bacterium SBLK]|nr:hypothetical protein [Cyanobacteria bacterium SBLK]
MNKLGNFLSELAINPQQQLAFARDNNASAAIAKLGLSKEEQTAVESKSNAKIAAIFASENTPLAILCADPNPEDPYPDPDPQEPPEEPSE